MYDLLCSSTPDEQNKERRFFFLLDRWFIVSLTTLDRLEIYSIGFHPVLSQQTHTLKTTIKMEEVRPRYFSNHAGNVSTN